MAITPRFTRADVEKRFQAFLDEIERKQIERLQILGEMCVIHARSVPAGQGFEDQTGNLRSSIGYMVFNDGVAVHRMYDTVSNGSEGAKTGEALAIKVGEASKGICLIVTAGMNYALYLESKGRDVIASAEHLAQRTLPRMLEKLVSNIKRAAE
ncbi:hypothetical protein AwDysgo_12970 [Bacteroidales bacterium]|nr:hypothetical protein AwDysgo_12970 [Bacteroidales bacterium]